MAERIAGKSGLRLTKVPVKRNGRVNYENRWVAVEGKPGEALLAKPSLLSYVARAEATAKPWQKPGWPSELSRGEIRNLPDRPRSVTHDIEAMGVGPAAAGHLGLAIGHYGGGAIGHAYSGRASDALKDVALLAVGIAPGATILRRPTGRTAIQSGRGLTQDEAMAAALNGSHLKQMPSGKYSGAPDWVDSPQALGKMRRDYDAMLQEGGDHKGWYDRTRAFSNEVTGSDRVKNDRFADQLAITSAQATPETNLGFALRGHNNAALGEPVTRVRTDMVATEINKVTPVAGIQVNRGIGDNGGPPMDALRIPLGKKTGQYGDRINPNIEEWGMGANDIWHARNFGYKEPDGAPFSRALTAQQQAFIDGETLLATHRANTNAYGGSETWTPGQVQEVPWVIARARTFEIKRKMSREAALAESNKTYADYADKHTVQVTHEAMPGANTGHLDGLKQVPGGIEAFDQAVGQGWATAPGGRDVIYDSMGLYVRPTADMRGIYQGTQGVEFNKGQTARPMTDVTQTKQGKEIAPVTSRAVTAAESFRGYMDAQEGSAWSYVDPKAPPTARDAIFVPLDRALSESEARAVHAAAQKRGMSVVDTGTGVVVKDFSDAGTKGKDLSAALKSGLRAELKQALPAGGEPARVRHTGGYVDRTSPDSGLGKQNEGTGRATAAMLKDLDAAPVGARVGLDAEPVRAATGQIAVRDAQIGSKYRVVVRRDIQNARTIYAKEGIDGLRRALRRGAYLPIAVPLAIGASPTPDRSRRD